MLTNSHYDIVIVGGGMVGLTAAALLKNHFSVAVVEPEQPPLSWSADEITARVSAIHVTSQKLFQFLQIWQRLEDTSFSPLKKMRVWDDQSAGKIHFDSEDIGKAQLGYIVENRALIKTLWQSLQQNNNVDFFVIAPEKITTENSVQKIILQNGQHLSTRLLIAADGGHSWIRQALQIPVVEKPYQQQALIAVTENSLDHHDTALQNFSKVGILGVLPLNHRKRTALVWSTSSVTDFSQELSQRLQYKLGEMQLLTPIKSFPLVMRHVKRYVGEGFAFIGDAAHTIHPLAGQGANLGLMDAACLAEVLWQAKQQQKTWYRYAVLRRYERWRKGRNQVMIWAMSGFKKLFSNQYGPVPFLRSKGMNSVDQLVCLKSGIMRYASGDMSDLPDFLQ